jgi:hypothetical protein
LKPKNVGADTALGVLRIAANVGRALIGGEDEREPLVEIGLLGLLLSIGGTEVPTGLSFVPIDIPWRLNRSSTEVTDTTFTFLSGESLLGILLLNCGDVDVVEVGEDVGDSIIGDNCGVDGRDEVVAGCCCGCGCCGGGDSVV